MLSSDLFSYLDSDNSSSSALSPVDWTLSVVQQEEFQQQLDETIIPEENEQIYQDFVSESTSLLSETCSSNLPENNINSKTGKNIEINMGSDDEDELVKYLSGSNKAAEPPPCLKLVRKLSRKPTTVPSFPSVKLVPSQDSPGPCMSKNAIAARETRQRKKKQLESLEESLSVLKSENKLLRSQNEGMKSSIKELTDEVTYLKSVLANQSLLAGLLKNIQNTPGVKFQSSFFVNMKKPIPQKPTATVAGRVKPMSSKRKMPPSYAEETENRPLCSKTEKNKRLCQDHGYAAVPVAVATSDVQEEKFHGNYSLRSNSDTKTEKEIVLPSEDESSSSGGVCLHVSKGCVSLEFCAVCSEKATHTLRGAMETDMPVVNDQVE